MSVLALAPMPFLSACSSDPGRAVFEKAEKSLSDGDADSALKQYGYVIANNPESAYAAKSQYKIALIYNRYIGDRKKAMEAYSALFFLYPGTAETTEAREDLASIYSVMGEHRLAIEQYQLLLNEKPSDYDKFQYAIAMEYIMQNDFRQARVEFTELLKRANADLQPQINYQIANTYYIEGNLAEAADGYEKTAARFPDNPAALDARLGTAKVLSESGKLALALALLKELKGKYPNKGAIGIMMDSLQTRLDEGPGSKKRAVVSEKEPLRD
ncbi:MAG: tetratricopeptide repeat protein [Deltaproteobacteria bacterium]|nr:tetratricopeptide repeat protein [Deltaproteobacteria bacterium]